MLNGIIVPNLTPMDPSGTRINYDAVGPMVAFLVERGVHGLFVNGTTGEGPLLGPEERQRMLEAVLEAVDGRLPVVAHVGAVTTQEAVDHARHAARVGADGAACITPYYFRYGDEALAAHFLAVARAAPDLPFYLYNLPGLAVNQVSAGLAGRLVQEPNIIGVKDSSGDVASLRRFLQIPGFSVLSGDDKVATAAFRAGAAGMISGPAAVIPEPYVAMWSAWTAGDEAAVTYWHGVIVACLPPIGWGARFDLYKALAGRRIAGMGIPRPPLPQGPPEEMNAAARHLYDVLRHTRLPKAAYGWLQEGIGVV